MDGKDIVVGMGVTIAVGALCQIGDTRAAIDVVNASAGHLHQDVIDMLYEKILGDADCGEPQ